jgi:hypothetical protein
LTNGIISSVARTFIYGFILFTLAVVLWSAFGFGLDDTDKSGDYRSGLRLHTDYKTGVQYLSDGKGGMVVRVDTAGNPVVLK